MHPGLYMFRANILGGPLYVQVSLYGHSLGSVLTYDILCHQDTLKSPFPVQSINAAITRNGEIEDDMPKIDRLPSIMENEFISEGETSVQDMLSSANTLMDSSDIRPTGTSTTETIPEVEAAEEGATGTEDVFSELDKIERIAILDEDKKHSLQSDLTNKEHAEVSEEVDIAEEHSEVFEDDIAQEHTEVLEQEHIEALEDGIAQEHTEVLEDDVAQEHSEVIEDDVAQEHTEVIEDDVAQEHTEVLEDDSTEHEHREAPKGNDVSLKNDVAQEHIKVPGGSEVPLEHTEVPMKDDVAQEHTEVLVKNDVAQEHTEVPVKDDVAQEHTEAPKENDVSVAHTEVTREADVAQDRTKVPEGFEVSLEHTEVPVKDDIAQEHIEVPRESDVSLKHTEVSEDDDVAHDRAEISEGVGIAEVENTDGDVDSEKDLEDVRTAERELLHDFEGINSEDVSEAARTAEPQGAEQDALQDLAASEIERALDLVDQVVMNSAEDYDEPSEIDRLKAEVISRPFHYELYTGPCYCCSSSDI